MFSFLKTVYFPGKKLSHTHLIKACPFFSPSYHKKSSVCAPTFQLHIKRPGCLNASTGLKPVLRSPSQTWCIQVISPMIKEPLITTSTGLKGQQRVSLITPTRHINSSITAVPGCKHWDSEVWEPCNRLSPLCDYIS